MAGDTSQSWHDTRARSHPLIDVIAPESPTSTEPVYLDHSRPGILTAGSARTAIDFLVFWAQTSPDRVALDDGERSWTYVELLRAADAFADALRRLPASERRRVLLTASKSADAVVAICGTMLAGWTLACIDDKLPPAVRSRALAKIGADVLVPAPRDTATGHEVDGAGAHVLTPALVRAADEDRPLDDVRSEARPDDLYNIAFTSGSTGEPKAIATTHRVWLDVITRYVRDFAFDSDDRVGIQASFAYDGVMDLCSAFAVGARAVLMPDGLYDDGPAWARFVRTHGITTIMTVPAAMRFTLESFEPTTVFPRMRRLILTGDRITAYELELLRRHLPPGVRLMNLYATTEVFYALKGEIDPNDYATANRLDPPSSDMDHALPREILDGEPTGLHTLQVGPGSSFCGYVTAPDHIEQPERTVGRFDIGDLFRLTDAGKLEFVGRRDRRIKWNGFRIEPEEIEHAALSHPGIREATVSVNQTNHLVLTYQHDCPNSMKPDLHTHLQALIHSDLSTFVSLHISTRRPLDKSVR